MKIRKIGAILMTSVIAVTLLVAGCTAPGATTPGQGTVQVYVTDAPPQGVTAIDIKASNIQAHLSGANESDWVTLVQNPPVFDLVKATGVNILLGSANISTGNYTQVRLTITDVTVTINGSQVKATVPSDSLKLVGPFTIKDGEQTPISIDFDAEKSIVMEGNGKVSLKPVVKLVVAEPGKKLDRPIGGTTPTTPTTQGKTNKTGVAQMMVTDAPRSDNVSEIWVTVTDIKIHEASGANVTDNGSDEVEGVTDNDTSTAGWITANLTGPTRFELLALRGENGTGIQQLLGTATLAVGQYTQIRMTVSKVEVKLDGVLKDATLPSGKLKFVHPFEIQADNTTKLVFDFDADKFVKVTGSPDNPQILVSPVVKLIVSKPAKTVEEPEKPALRITTPNLPSGTVGANYTATLAATGGTLPYTWSLVSGNLTAGLTLSAAGVISGIPSANTTGEYDFTVKVTDNSTPVKTATKDYELTILP